MTALLARPAVPAAPASPLDAFAHGEYRGSTGSSERIVGRLGRRADPGRYHLYVAAPSAAAHRVAILRALAGLRDDVSMSGLDARRDGRGWAFRGATGVDPVNGFTLLREAYERSRPGFAGVVSVPVLWDRWTGSIISNDATTIGVDLLTAFDFPAGPPSLYPADEAAAIERAGSWVEGHLSAHVGRAVYEASAAETVQCALRKLDAHLAARSWVVGGALTDADVRLWVHLVRYDAGPNAHGVVGPRLDAYPSLWRWARAVWSLDGVRESTDLASFAAPYADLPPWG